MIALVVDQQLPKLGVAARLAGLSGLGYQLFGDIAAGPGLLIDLDDRERLDAARADLSDDLGAGIVVAVESLKLTAELAVAAFGEV